MEELPGTSGRVRLRRDWGKLVMGIKSIPDMSSLVRCGGRWLAEESPAFIVRRLRERGRWSMLCVNLGLKISSAVRERGRWSVDWFQVELTILRYFKDEGR